MFRTFLRHVQALAAVAFATTALLAAFAGPRVNTSSKGLAIKGYDPVAYFTEQTAVRGDERFQALVDGVTYRFSTAQNRDRFTKDSAAYVPQYGGFCAWAVSRGYTADVDPEAWSVMNGKLYLNYSKSVRAKWLQDPAGNIRRGDANWPRLLAEGL